RRRLHPYKTRNIGTVLTIRETATLAQRLRDRKGYVRTMAVCVREHALSQRVVEHSPRARVGLSIWAAIVSSGIATAIVLRATGARISIDAPPLHARVAPVLGAAIVFPFAVATIVVVYGPRVARRLRWCWLLAASTGATATWALSLAVVRGSHRIV